MQTREEMLRIWTDWVGLYAPHNFIDNDNSQTLLADYINKHYGGIPSFTALNAAVVAHAAQVLKPEPTPAQIEVELANKAHARMHKEYLESLKPQETLEQQKMGQARLDANKKERDAKELKSLNSQIEREISGHCANHPTIGIDYSRTEYERGDLRAVRDQHNRSTINGARTALAAVRATKSKL